MVTKYTRHGGWKVEEERWGAAEWVTLIVMAIIALAAIKSCNGAEAMSMLF